MKNKMEQLKAAAWDAHNAEVEGKTYRDHAWVVYINADKAVAAARDASEKAAKAINSYHIANGE